MILLLVVIAVALINKDKLFSRADINDYDVIVVGGGTGGSAAAIQSARLGAKTLLLEETDWLGGMYTSAGVTAFDGPINTNAASGLYLEIAQKIEQYYGQLATSHGYSFNCVDYNNCPAMSGPYGLSSYSSEPVVTENILNSIVRNESNLSVLYKMKVIQVVKDSTNNKKITGVIATDQNDTQTQFTAKVVVDATEYGDVIAMSGAAFNFGRESRSQTGEPDAPVVADNKIQPICYTIPLRKFDSTQGMPNYYDPIAYGYNADDFKNPTNEITNPVPWEPGPGQGGYTSYQWMPDSSQPNPVGGYTSFYLCYPNFAGGNDFLGSINPPTNVTDLFILTNNQPDLAKRQTVFAQAKRKSLNYLYFLKQNITAAANWGIDATEYPTTDQLPLIPYIRESRRLVATKIIKEQDILAPDPSQHPSTGRGVFEEDAIAVADMPMDIHPVSETDPNQMPWVYPYQIPYGVLVPIELDGLLGAEKNIGVTHLVNGSTRMQPTALVIGQAAGAAAALSAKLNVEPRQLNVALLQDVLLDNNLMLYYLSDVRPDHPAFKAIEILALRQIATGFDDYTYKPGAVIERATVAVELDRAFKIPENTTGGPHFADLGVNDFGYKEVESLYNAGLLDPFNHDCTEGSFCPSVGINRATLTSAIVKAKNLTLINPDSPSFSDVPKDYWAYQAIETALANGIVSQALNFNPDNDATRAEAAMMLYRATQNFGVSIQQVGDKSTLVHGETLTLTIVWQVGLADVNNAVITEPIPQGFNFVSATSGGQNIDGNVTWSLGNQVAKNQGLVRFTIQYQP